MLILGSGSNARKDLLSSVGYKPNRIIIPDIDENSFVGERPKDYVTRMAVNKSKKINVDDNDFLITADTIVVIGRRIFHKSNNINIARKNLEMLSGKSHKVYTAFCVRNQGNLFKGLEKTSLKMKYLNAQGIEDYLKKDEWQDKAGCYSFQGFGKTLFLKINGCFSNVIGLPLPKLLNKLEGLGYRKRDCK